MWVKTIDDNYINLNLFDEIIVDEDLGGEDGTFQVIARKHVINAVIDKPLFAGTEAQCHDRAAYLTGSANDRR